MPEDKAKRAARNRKYRKVHALELTRRRKQRFANHKALGLCIFCKNKAAEGYTSCLSCLERHRKNQRSENKVKKLARNNTYRGSHKASLQQSRKLENLYTKIEVLTHYGNGKLSCVKCGFDDIRVLSIDHINGDGAKHRRLILGASRTGGSQLYHWLKKNNYPQGYQTLCMNCQWIKRVDNNELSHTSHISSSSLSPRLL